jgi:hypothetical protein
MLKNLLYSYHDKNITNFLTKTQKKLKIYPNFPNVEAITKGAYVKI